MLSWAGSDAAIKSKHTKIAKKQEPSIIKIPQNATVKLDNFRHAIMKKRKHSRIQNED